jgi:hypothetical protein
MNKAARGKFAARDPIMVLRRDVVQRGKYRLNQLSLVKSYQSEISRILKGRESPN